ncbi:MAG: HD domain-containing protein [Nitrospiraceae bacterium]|nr:HD domain-containing protein [Nitrospiraceae bacterium]
MLLKLKPGDLRPGMFVILPASGAGNLFPKNSFLIRSERQIEKIIKSGLAEVTIDTQKGAWSTRESGEELSTVEEEQAPYCASDPQGLVQEILKETVSSRISKEKKAKIVYLSSLEIMSKLFEDPKVERIAGAKSGLFHVVDAIFSDDIATDLIRLLRHDYYTYTHSVNVGTLSILLAKALFKDPSGHNMHELGAGFFLHDLGKTRIPTGIINKPGRLDAQEWEVMKTHPVEGYNLLAAAGHLTEESRIITMQHHEQADGSGYPMGLKGDQIFPYARICRIADIFDALTSWRPYQRARSVYTALTIMRGMGLHRDLFVKFVRLFERR